MKKLLLIITLLILASVAIAQPTPANYTGGITHNLGGYRVDSGLRLPLRPMVQIHADPFPVAWIFACTLDSELYYEKNGMAHTFRVITTEDSNTIKGYITKHYVDSIAALISNGVTSVTAGAGLVGGTITGVGTIGMPNVGIPSTFGNSTHVPQFTTDAQGRIISVTNVLIAGGGGGGSGTVTDVTAGSGLSGGTITTSGTISLPNTGTAGTYGSATQVPVFTTDVYGRITGVTNTAITHPSEVDPVFTASIANNLTAIDTTHYNLAWLKYIVSGAFSTGAAAFTRLDGTTFTVTGFGTVTSVAAGAGLSGGTFSTSGTISMPNTGTAGTFGSATQIPVFTTDAQGRITGVTNTSVTFPSEVDPVYTASIAFNLTAVDTTHYNLAWLKYIVSGAFSTGTATYTRLDGTTFTVTGFGTVTSVTAGTGLSGGTFTTSGTVSMPNTGTPGTNGTSTLIPVFVTDAQGRVTSSTNTTIGTLNQNTTGTASNVTGIVLPVNGGSGIANNNASTLTISGNFGTTITVTGTSAITIPTSGTLYGTASGSITSSQFFTSLSDETGSGFAVGSISPALTGSPTCPTQAAGDASTKMASDAFVHTEIANAIAASNPAVAVQAATTANIPNLVYVNGVGGIGATLTQTVAAVIVVDGYTGLLNDRFLFKDQTTSAYNGVWVLSTLGTGVINAVFTRALDYDQPSDINNTGAIPVINGADYPTGNKGSSWQITSSVTTIGADPLTYIIFTYEASKVGLTTNPLSQFATTTSSQFFGVISDETGTGAAVAAVSPALTGSPTAPTQSAGDNSTKIASTAYVDAGLSGKQATGNYITYSDTSISAAYTLTSRDLFRSIHCTNGSNIALTVPTGLGTTFRCEVIQEGAGTVTPTTSSTTFNFIPTATTKTKQTGSIIFIRSWATANTYTIQGDLQ